MSYRDGVANIVNPRTVIDRTAAAIVAHLLANPHGVVSRDLRSPILAGGGNRRYLANAVRALRNAGYDIVSVKARQNSWYKLGATAIEQSAQDRSIAREDYSTALRRVRELATAVLRHPTLQAAYSEWVARAIVLGQAASGKSPTDVMTDLAASPAAAVVSPARRVVRRRRASVTP